MPTDPPTTTNYNFPLIPPLDSEYRDEWGFLINDGTFSDGTSSSSTDGLIKKVDTVINNHVTDTTNPHSVNYSQTGAIQDANSTVTRSNISPSFYTQSEADSSFLEQGDGFQTYTAQDSVSDAGTANPVVYAGSFTPRASQDGGNVWLSVSDQGSGEGGSAQFLITLGYQSEPTIYSFGESDAYPSTLTDLNFYWRTPSTPHRTEIAVEHTGGNSGSSLTVKTAAWGVSGMTAPSSTTLADYSSTSTHKYVAADGNGDVNVSGGTLSEQSNRVATRTWATGNNILHSELADSPSAAHHAKYTDSEAVTAVNAETSLTVDISGDSDTVDGYEGDDLARPKNVAVLTSTDTSTDINQTSWTVIPWDNQLDIDAGYTHDPANSPGQITFDNGGTYRVKAMLTYDSNGSARINPGVRLSINGTRRDALGLSGYVRNASGHNEGSNYIEETITVNSGDTLRVEAYRYGSGGYVTMRSNESELIIEQVSKTVSISGDTDTVDGYHAADFVLAGGDTMSGDLKLGSNNLDMANGARIREENTGRFGFRDSVNSNYTSIEVDRVYYHNTSSWFNGSHDSLSSVGSSDHHSKYTDSEAVSAVESGSPVMSTTLNMNSNGLYFQPASAGGSVTGLTFESNTNAGSDYGYIEYHDDYFGSGSGESSALVFRTENDSTDKVVLDGAGGTVIQNGTLDMSGHDLEDVGTTIWDASAGYVPESSLQTLSNSTLSNSSLTVAGNSVSLGGSTSISHSNLSDSPSSAHHSKTSAASELTDVSPDSTSGAHHSKYTDENAQDAVGTIVGNALSYDDVNNSIDVSEGNISHDNISGVSSSDHHSKTSSASELTDVSADSTSNAHHSKYTDSEARSALTSTGRVGGSGLFFDFNNNSNYIELIDGNNNRDQLVTEDVYINQTNEWLGDDHLGVNSAHHSKTSSASELSDVSADSVSGAHHSRYSDSEARTAVDGANVSISGSSQSVTTSNFEIVENSSTNSLDFNYTG